MTYTKLFVGLLIVLCTAPSWAEQGRDLRTNNLNAGRDVQNTDVGNEQRPRNDVAPAPAYQRNEGFGYGFERRQQQMDRQGGFGRRGRN
jgi:hypothetical protein